MAKRDQLGKSFGTGRRKKPSLKEVDEIVEATSKPTQEPEKPKQVNPDVPMKKTSLDLPLDLYKELKIKLINDQVKFKDYITRLIKADLLKNK